MYIYIYGHIYIYIYSFLDKAFTSQAIFLLKPLGAIFSQENGVVDLGLQYNTKENLR